MKAFLKDLTIVIAIVLTLGGVATVTSSTACAPKTYHSAVVADDAIAQSLFALAKSEQAAYDAHAYPQVKHQQYAAAITKALKAGNAINDAVDSWTPSQPAPAAVADAVKGLSAVLDDLVGILPANNPFLVSLRATLALFVPRG